MSDKNLCFSPNSLAVGVLTLRPRIGAWAPPNFLARLVLPFPPGPDGPNISLYGLSSRVLPCPPGGGVPFYHQICFPFGFPFGFAFCFPFGFPFGFHLASRVLRVCVAHFAIKCAINLLSICNQFTIILQSICNIVSINLQSISNKFVINLLSICNQFALKLKSFCHQICYQFAIN